MSGVTADDFSKAMAKFLPNVETLLADSPKHAFNLLMDLGYHAYGDLDYCVRSSGYGDTEEPYKEMDEMMLKVIEKRVEARSGEGKEDEEEVAATEANDSSEGELAAYMNELGGKRPNKSERNKIDKWRRVDFKAKVERARLRRETAKDWELNALRDLVKTREYIGKYGIGEHYFRQSIARLEGFKSSP